MKKFLIITLALSALIFSLSIAYYLVIFVPQKERVKLEQQKVEQETKIKQEQKDYIAKRKAECYSIYEKERKEFSNVEGYGYNEMDDVCVVRYKAVKGEWEGINCEDYAFKEGQEFNLYLAKMHLECITNTFTKEF